MLVIDEISGMLDHSPACQQLIEMSKNPIIPLHPDLREHTLSLLRSLTPISHVRLLCRTWATKRWGDNPGDAQYRFTLTEYESTSLYHTLRREDGIPENSKALDNLDRWFRKNDPKPPSSVLTQSCLNYQPLGPGISDRLVIILSTARQQEMAWKFGHKRQMLMDGTFGVCSTCVLVFFLMVIDDRNVGVPVATIMFTPKKDAKAGHASYDRPLLSELLKRWKVQMGTNVHGEEFDMRVGNTDNDTHERFALQQNWTLIFLLLCMFHSWQAWRNGLNRNLGCVPKGDARKAVRSHLGKFLMRQLKEITDYSEAIDAYNQELAYFRSLGTRGNNAIDMKKSQGGLAFLAYFKTYLNLRSFWMSWSKAGAVEAARILDIPVKDVPRTTNHLESFNGRIKQKYFTAYQRSGRLPRLDVWVMIMVTQVMVDFFNEYDERRRAADYYNLMRYAAPTRPTISHSISPPQEEINQFDTAVPVTIIPASTSAIVTELNDDVENSMMQELEDDGADELDGGSDSEEEEDLDMSVCSEDLEGMGIPLVVDPDGEGSSFSSDSADGSLQHTPEDFDMALDESVIIRDLPSDMSLPFPFALNQATSQHLSTSPELDILDMDLVSFKVPDADTAIPTQHSNAEAIAYQEVVLAEDHLTEQLRNLLSISADPNIHAIVAPHLSPRIQSQLLMPALPDHNHQCQESSPDQIHGLITQKKERRKESHRIR